MEAAELQALLGMKYDCIRAVVGSIGWVKVKLTIPPRT